MCVFNCTAAEAETNLEQLHSYRGKIFKYSPGKETQICFLRALGAVARGGCTLVWNSCMPSSEHWLTSVPWPWVAARLLGWRPWWPLNLRQGERGLLGCWVLILYPSSISLPLIPHPSLQNPPVCKMSSFAKGCVRLFNRHLWPPHSVSLDRLGRHRAN